jgi:hypothetical protein
MMMGNCLNNKPLLLTKGISDVPVFTFKGEYDMYNRTLKQPSY